MPIPQKHVERLYSRPAAVTAKRKADHLRMQYTPPPSMHVTRPRFQLPIDKGKVVRMSSTGQNLEPAPQIADRSTFWEIPAVISIPEPSSMELPNKARPRRRKSVSFKRDIT